MQPTIILGEIQGGRILTEQPLADFEGKKVAVSVLDPELTVWGGAGEANTKPPSELLPGADEPVLLKDLGRIRISARRVTAMKARIIDVGRLPPRVYSSDEED